MIRLTLRVDGVDFVLLVMAVRKYMRDLLLVVALREYMCDLLLLAHPRRCSSRKVPYMDLAQSAMCA
jgi:hypothetical protein